MWFFYDFNFGKNHDVLQCQEFMHFVEQKYKFNKNETESKMENATHTQY